MGRLGIKPGALVLQSDALSTGDYTVSSNGNFSRFPLQALFLQDAGSGHCITGKSHPQAGLRKRNCDHLAEDFSSSAQLSMKF